MTQEQAAKYLIVAWLKDWSLTLYLSTVSRKRHVSLTDAHDLFPWLPADPFIFLLGVKTRRYLAAQFPAFNDALFDAKDNSARLAMVPRIMQLDSANAGPWKRDRMFVKAVREVRDDMRQFTLARNLEHRSIAEMRKGSGHHWGVCK